MIKKASRIDTREPVGMSKHAFVHRRAPVPFCLVCLVCLADMGDHVYFALCSTGLSDLNRRQVCDLLPELLSKQLGIFLQVLSVLFDGSNTVDETQHWLGVGFSMLAILFFTTDISCT